MPTSAAPPDSPAYIGWQLRDQARSCRRMGSPLYAFLLDQAAADAVAGGAVHRLLRSHAGPGRSSALALRFLAAVHRLVLSGRAPALAAHYPSAGGDGDPVAGWDRLLELCEHEHAVLDDLIARPCQTNEVGRCAGLAVGFLVVAAAGLPLRLLEVGASAGLNLRWDRYRYGGAGVTFGPFDSPVDLSGLWADAPPHVDAPVAVAARAGCDPRPVDPTSADGQLTLRASVWADQRERFTRLTGAVAVAAEVPATVDRASADVWLAERLAEPSEGVATVVYHSVVEEYLEPDVRERVRTVVAEAGARATPAAPLAWVRLEPVLSVRRHGVTLNTWPAAGSAQRHGGEPHGRLLATCGAHGQDVRLMR